MLTVLFLGYDTSKTRLINFIKKKGHKVFHNADKITSVEQLKGYNLAISFGYKHIIPKHILEQSQIPIINLHISYLPFNRGAHPNFWAFYENTPHGVSIHIIDEGIDTGPILFQKRIDFDKENTFNDTYQRLINEIEELFIDNFDAISTGDYVLIKQRGVGSFHKASDLPHEIIDWNVKIVTMIEILDEKYGSSIERKLNLIDQIEAIRSKNNVNWMDILRLAVRFAPNQSKEILARINLDDNKISELFAQLGQ